MTFSIINESFFKSLVIHCIIIKLFNNRPIYMRERGRYISLIDKKLNQILVKTIASLKERIFHENIKNILDGSRNQSFMDGLGGVFQWMEAIK